MNPSLTAPILALASALAVTGFGQEPAPLCLIRFSGRVA